MISEPLEYARNKRSCARDSKTPVFVIAAKGEKGEFIHCRRCLSSKYKRAIKRLHARAVVCLVKQDIIV